MVDCPNSDRHSTCLSCALLATRFLLDGLRDGRRVLHMLVHRTQLFLGDEWITDGTDSHTIFSWHNKVVLSKPTHFSLLER